MGADVQGTNEGPDPANLIVIEGFAYLVLSWVDWAEGKGVWMLGAVA